MPCASAVTVAWVRQRSFRSETTASPWRVSVPASSQSPDCSCCRAATSFQSSQNTTCSTAGFPHQTRMSASACAARFSGSSGAMKFVSVMCTGTPAWASVSSAAS